MSIGPLDPTIDQVRHRPTIPFPRRRVEGLLDEAEIRPRSGGNLAEAKVIVMAQTHQNPEYITRAELEAIIAKYAKDTARNTSAEVASVLGINIDAIDQREQLKEILLVLRRLNENDQLRDIASILKYLAAEETRSDLTFLRTLRAGTKMASVRAFTIAITLLTGAMLYMLWDGLRHKLMGP